MSAGDEPTPVGAHLAAAADALRARADKADLRPRRPIIPDDELAQVRADGAKALRAESWAGVVPRRFQGARIDDMPEPVAADLQDWADGPDGRNLLLFGPVGTGKTHAAVAAVRPCHDRGMRVQFWPVVELLDELRPGGTEGAFGALASVDVLVVDDLGTERPTDWTGERLGALVNRRWLEQLPIVVTTNLPGGDGAGTLQEAVGPRTYSRLVGGAVGVVLGGDDRRRTKRAR